MAGVTNEVTHRAIKPLMTEFLVYADKKLMTLTPVDFESGSCLVKKMRDTAPLMDVELVGVRRVDGRTNIEQLSNELTNSGGGRLTPLSAARAHSVVVSIADEVLRFTFNCAAEDGEMCVVKCVEGCESWHHDHEQETGHKLVAIDKCNFVEWMDASDQDDFDLDVCLYAGPAFVLYSGPIEIEYGDGYTWSFIDTEEGK